jgi:hypothetical protein
MQLSQFNPEEGPAKDNPALSKVIERNIRTIIHLRTKDAQERSPQICTHQPEPPGRRDGTARRPGSTHRALTEHELTRVLQMLKAVQDKLGIVDHENSELADLEMETKAEDVLAEIHRLQGKASGVKGKAL